MKLRLCLHSRYQNQLKTVYNEQKLWSATGHVKIWTREVGGLLQPDGVRDLHRSLLTYSRE